MAAIIGPATPMGAIEFFDSLVKKGRSPSGVVSPLKSAVTKVLQKTEGDSWGQTDLTALDIEDTMWRFKNLTLNEYSEGSYRTYEMRLKKAIEWYLKFRRNPGWIPPETARQTVPQKPDAVSDTSVPRPGGGDLDASPVFRTSTRPIATALTYPFPLASGKIAELHIPTDVTASDIERMRNFLESLIIREEQRGGAEYGP